MTDPQSPGTLGVRRSCRECGRPSVQTLCRTCYQTDRRDRFAPLEEWAVCTRCGFVNGRHAADCERLTDLTTTGETNGHAR